jgi:quercetin dioxygenase-like cupin family protein
MEVQPKGPSVKGTPDKFVGDAWFDVIVDDRLSTGLRASVVHFAPGARNAWHAHAMGQTLHVLEGIGRTQARGGEVIEIRAGDTIHTPPGEWHWHGAAPDHVMSHLTLYEADRDGRPETEWGEHVTDDEYARGS